MGYGCKVQKIKRETQNTYYVNLPSAIAEALEIEKGELLEWFIEDRNTLVLKRKIPLSPREFKNIS
jgi:hypothetical protein